MDWWHWVAFEVPSNPTQAIPGFWNSQHPSARSVSSGCWVLTVSSAVCEDAAGSCSCLSCLGDPSPEAGPGLPGGWGWGQGAVPSLPAPKGNSQQRESLGG